jgi:Fe-S cluster assembly iron-binding protein IscA
MLRMTESAAFALRELLAAYTGRPGAVLRIVLRPDVTGTPGLMLSLSNPGEGDLLITDRGLRVFLEPDAAVRIDGKLLDARIEPNRVRFLVVPSAQAS